MNKTRTTRYDVVEHLRTPKEIAAYFETCLEKADGDAAFIAKALGDIARAKGMSQIARDSGLSRESLYKALSGERSPDFETILKVLGALGLELHAKVARESLDAAGSVKTRVKAPTKAAAAVGKQRANRGPEHGSVPAAETRQRIRGQRISAR